MLPRLKCASKKSDSRADRAFVERLRLGELVAAVMNVGQVDQRGDEAGSSSSALR